MTLTAKQEQFCQNVALHKMNYSDAYREAYNTSKMKPESINEKASALAKDVKVTSRIEHLKATLEEETIQEIGYERSQSFKVFNDNILGLQKTLTEVLKDPDLSLKDKAHLENMLRKNIKEQEQEKAKLYSLYVEKKDLTMNFAENWLDELK